MDSSCAQTAIISLLLGLVAGLAICKLMRPSLARQEPFQSTPDQQGHADLAYEYDAGLAEGFYAGKMRGDTAPKYSGAVPPAADVYESVDFAVGGPRDKLASRAYLDFVSNGLLGAATSTA
jgi:hypothetical protein